MDIGAIWDLVILQPVTNVLITLSHYLWGNFGLAIIILTLVINGVMYPLTLRQMRTTKSTQDLQPKLAELKKKHGNDSQALAQEQMKLYKESGLSPAGCLLPMLLQMPIWIALYQSIIRVMAVNPENFVNLSRYLYSWPLVFDALPLNNSFLWTDLAVPDMLMAIMVGALMWIQQKMTPTQSNPDPQQKAQTQTMQVVMPLMFTFLSLSFPSGLALYWATSNLIRIVIQYFFSGWGGLAPMVKGLVSMLPFGTSKKTLKPRRSVGRSQVVSVQDETGTTAVADVNQSAKAAGKTGPIINSIPRKKRVDKNKKPRRK